MGAQESGMNFVMQQDCSLYTKDSPENMYSLQRKTDYLTISTRSVVLCAGHYIPIHGYTFEYTQR